MRGDHDQISHHPFNPPPKKNANDLVYPPSLMLSIRSIASRAIFASNPVSLRGASYATLAEDKHKYKVVIVGAGALLLLHLKLVFPSLKESILFVDRHRRTCRRKSAI